MIGFEWLNKIFDYLWQFVPQMRVVDTRYGALKWTTIRLRDLGRGRWEPSAKLMVLGAGFHVYWPLFSKFEERVVKRQTIPLPSQVITTTDDVTVVVSGMVAVEILDLGKAVGETWDTDDTIKDVAAASLHDVCCHKSWPELTGGQGRTLDTALRREAQKDLTDYGARVLKFTLTTMAKTRVYRLVQSTTQEGEIV